tara:strand:- start:1495 stop:1860 length:366 start_codon:yes stop_codon:yes gene_type:complete
MKLKLSGFFGLMSFLTLADDGALRAAGTGGLVMVLLPIMGILAILFLIASVDRFLKPNALSSRMMNYNGSMLMFLIFILLSLFQSQNFLFYSLIALEVILLFILFLNWKYRANLPSKDSEK